MKKHSGMRPQDVMILLKVVANYNRHWNESFGQIDIMHPLRGPFWKKNIATQLKISPSEVTESLARSVFAGLYDPDQKRVMARALFEFLQYGLKYVFPQQPGALVRGIPTAHSG